MPSYFLIPFVIKRRLFEQPLKGDGVTGAPVTELEYMHAGSMPYSMRLVWRHAGKSGVVPRELNLVPLDFGLGGGIFLFVPAGWMEYL